jgi:hypothetical protein
MKTLVLTLILAVVCFAAFEYHQDQQRQNRERLEDAYRGCLSVAPGSELCKTLGKQLEDAK